MLIQLCIISLLDNQECLLLLTQYMYNCNLKIDYGAPHNHIESALK
jgi:hypothetical protein